MSAVGIQVDSVQELRNALASSEALEAWLATRGYSPEVPGLPPLSRKSLQSARAFRASGAVAPRLLVLWRPDLAERAVHGNQLRALQQDANQFVLRLRAEAPGVGLPDLCLVGTPDFMLLFALDGNAFSRRLRFTPERLRPGSPLQAAFRAFGAPYLAGMKQAVVARDEGDVLRGILGGDEASGWDFSRLFVGGKLDEDFVNFMSHERRRIAGLLVDDPKGRALLKVMWPHLKDAARADDAGTRMPPLADLVKQGRFRHALVAAIDTVLLRLVLYRYLEAQFGYQQSEAEQRQVAFGSYDELLEQTTRFEPEKLAGLMKRIRAGEADTAELSGQMDLFAPPVRFTQEEAFVRGVKERAGRYQAVAGGDLHHGSVAEAASLLQDFLLEQHSEEFALLLEGTRTSQYSFHYADLDPRAFQRFYEETIGTDLRVAAGADGTDRVSVVDFERNRKEQGAYFTHEQLCAWLAERTLGKTFDEWLVRVEKAASAHAGNADARRVALHALLDEMLDWKVIDPTCGGGIFLRSAFELLSARRERVQGFLQDTLPKDAFEELTASGRYRLFSPDAELGEWEWHILLNMLYGVDVDVKAINVASNLLTLSALSYKRNGLCFPSFVNTSLKRGNALVPLLKPDERAAFAKACAKELRQLISIRTKLRNPALPRSTWTTLHGQAADITRNLSQAYIVKAFAGCFKGLKQREVIERVQEVGVFFYEAEFPEVFFDAKGALLPNPGFDVVLGNPPWEEPAAEYKHFLPEFDPEFRALSGQRAERRERELLRDPVIAKRWAVHEQSIEDYKSLLTAGWYEHQQRRVRGRLQGAHTNLYKYATELSWKLLKEGGRGGLVLDGGLWGDLASSGLRALLLDASSGTQFCGFTNNRGIFEDVHRSYKFGPCVFVKGGRTEALRAVFMRDRLEDLDVFDRISFEIPADEIRNDPRDSYPVPEARSVEHLAVDRTISAHATLQDDWDVDILAEELNAGRQREFFRPEQREGWLPLISGEQFNLFGVHQGAPPTDWVDPGSRGAGGFVSDRQRRRILMAIADHLESQGRLRGGRETAALEWLKGVTGRRELPDEWLRLDWDGYRIAWRDIARNDDRRTLIAGILPKRVAVTHTAPFVRPFTMKVEDRVGLIWEPQLEEVVLLYLAGMLSSFVCDSLARSRVTKTHLTPYLFKSLNVPRWNGSAPQRRVAELTARLTCLPATKERPWADYGPLAAAVGLKPKRDGLTNSQERREAEVELNALAAQLYGLSRANFRFLMDLLFMTPGHRDVHALLRDDICARLPEDASKPVSLPLARSAR